MKAEMPSIYSFSVTYWRVAGLCEESALLAKKALKFL
jgi:hypothetical protein